MFRPTSEHHQVYNELKTQRAKHVSHVAFLVANVSLNVVPVNLRLKG